MTWESKELGTARRSTQHRFKITLETLDYFSKEHLELVDTEDGTSCGAHFATELVDCLKDYLSIHDLQELRKEFKKEYERRVNNR